MDLQDDGISRFISNAPPTHYVFKIQLLSLLAKNSIERYESGIFEAGGYKWKLVLYPTGNKSINKVNDHISLYLAIDDDGVTSFQPDWEIYVKLRLFVLDQNNDNYLVVQDTFGKERRYNRMKVESGFDQFIALKDFNDGSKGYVVDDACVFGAEVFVCRERSRGKGESLVMKKDPITYKHTCRIHNYSALKECYISEPFSTGNYNWIMKLYPKGKGAGLGSSYVSLYIALAETSTLPIPGSKIYANILLRILDQHQNNHWLGKANYWISASSGDVGYSRFMLISILNSKQNSYLVNDSCSLEAEITIHGVVDALS